MKKLFIAVFFSVLFFVARSQDITPEDAKNYVGKTVTVCGKVKSTYQPNSVNSHPTFIDFGNKYPNAIFTAVIWESDLSKFSYKPKRKLKHKKICVTGVIKLYKEKPEIIVSNPSQIKIK
ncbi:MAG TPA: hypothetical protein VET23_11345 [Chitinophagaceae bacterium]|nr:hypothetical protein [Chitinophagaceae bacterium]